ncbi:hypothetical protein [Asticcacaulis sp.]|uniref:hypothetical protein n=1 Tax=Asticcacaulis sp. TaxID=1872648 RepID=UPI002D038A61|nr:hypothetical protein [Asticcacaulis sp.]HTM82511.1 hypothetical protein [Asticcacaulis sp.]
MKNIQIIDGASNCTFSIFQATPEEFEVLFPEADQDIQFSEDLDSLPEQDRVESAMTALYERPVKKSDAMGIHGTIFYELERYRKVYPGKTEASVDPSAISYLQRQLYGI